MSSSTFLPAKALVFDLCDPRPDVIQGVSDADFAADLAKVLRGEATPEYKEAGRFFANTYPTRGLRNLLENVCACLSGARPAAASIFRLDTTYGGGKTHALIALAHAANGMQGVSNVEEFVARELLPTGNVRVAAFDGENADPANGRRMAEGIYAKPRGVNLPGGWQKGQATSAFGRVMSRWSRLEQRPSPSCSAGSPL